MTDWQPIETAPRDGTPILASLSSDNEWRAVVVAFIADDDQWEDCSYTIRHPTHWMPLPDPPKD